MTAKPAAPMTCVIEEQPLPGVVAVNISGAIDENFPVDELLRHLGGDAVINLALVSECSSFGIRHWQSAMKEVQARARHCVLVECSPTVVSQLNTVLDFALGTHVKSVQLPYACDACKTGTVVTVDVDAEREALLRGEFPRPRCSLCAISMRFDEMAEDYFSFLRQGGPPPLGSALADFIARFEIARSAAAAASAPVPDSEATQAIPDLSGETDFGQLGVEGEESPTTPGEPIPALLAMAVRPAVPSTLSAAIAGQAQLMTPFEEEVSQLASAYADNGTTAPGLPGADVLALAGVAGSQPEASGDGTPSPGAPPPLASPQPTDSSGRRVEMVPFVTSDVTALVARPPGLGPPPRRSAPTPSARTQGVDWTSPAVRLGLAAGALVVLGLGFALARLTGGPPTVVPPAAVALREATALEIVELNTLLARDRFDAAEQLVLGIAGQLEESSRKRLSEIIARDRQNAVDGHRTRALAASADQQHREALAELKQAIGLSGPTEELLFLQVTLSADARDCRGLRATAEQFERSYPLSVQAQRVNQLRAACQEAPAVTAPPGAAPRPSGPPKVLLTQPEIVEVAVGNRRALVDCIQKHLTASKGGHGKLEMEWTVLPTGKVTGVRCNTPELRSSPLAACISTLISSWSFPANPARKNQQVQFPFKF